MADEQPQTTMPVPVPTPRPSAMAEHAERAKQALTGIGGAPQKSDGEIVLEMMDKILSSDNIEQKSRQIFENIRGIAQVSVTIEALIEGAAFCQIPPVDGFVFIEPSQVRNLKEFEDIKGFKQKDQLLMKGLATLCQEMTTRLVSLDGLGRKELIELAHAFSFQFQQHQHEKDLAGQLLYGGAKGPRR